MKRLLYITNIEVPYRVRFFNELAKRCRLTVLYESRSSQQRSKTWAKSEEKHFTACYAGKDLPAVLRQEYDAIILGCYQTPFQIMANLLLRLRKIPFFINLDGEPFLEGSSLKAKGKRFLLSGAAAYLTAGEEAAHSVKAVAGERNVTPYYFSSLTEEEVRAAPKAAQRDSVILVAGQYFPYKGLDVALAAARMAPELRFRFVGMGRRTERFCRKYPIPENVEILPFLQKQALEREYQTCALLVLPSRRECWGLVIQEAAAFGAPVVSTWGSGAAVEFLSRRYPQFLARPGDAEDLLRCIRRCLTFEDPAGYSGFLREKAKEYTIQRSVCAHLSALERERL